MVFKRHIFIYFSIILAGCFCFSAVGQAAPRQKPAYVPGRIIVKLKDTATSPVMAQAARGVSISASTSVANISNLQALNNKFKVQSAQELFRTPEDNHAIARSRGFVTAEAMKTQAQNKMAAIKAKFPRRSARIATDDPVELPHNIYVLQMDAQADVLQAVEEYAKDPNVEYAQPDYEVKVNTVVPPNDALYSQQWAPQLIHAPEAWDTTEGQGVVVAVVDTGVDYNHEDLQGNIWVNSGEIPNNGLDDDGNGYVDDVRGWSFRFDNNDPMDGNGHGTHVAGIIAAVKNNNVGIVGVAPQVKIMPLKGFDENGSGSTSDMAAGIVYAAQNGADVINNSWGCFSACPSNPIAEEAVRTAYALGAVIIFAAGNSNQDVNNFSPNNMAEVITVSSINQNSVKASTSNWGTTLDVAAPGVDVLSLNARGGDNVIARTVPSQVVDVNYLRLSGTSMAAPHVSAEAALVLAAHPTWDIEQVRFVIQQTADDIDAPGIDVNTGYGRINVEVAVDQCTFCHVVINSPKGVPLIGTVDINGSIEGVGFGSYDISYQQLGGTVWTNIKNGANTRNMSDELLATWDTRSLAPGDYMLRLQVHVGARDFTDTVQLRKADFGIEKISGTGSAPSTVSLAYPWVAWTDDQNVFAYDLSQKTKRQITSDRLATDGVRVWNNTLVYDQKRSSSDMDFIAHYLLDDRRLSFPHEEIYDGFRFDGTNIYYSGSGNYMVNIKTGIRTQLPVQGGSVDGWGGKVVFNNSDTNGAGRVFVRDLTTQQNKRITPVGADYFFPIIRGNNAVFFKQPLTPTNGKFENDVFWYDLNAARLQKIGRHGEGADVVVGLSSGAGMRNYLAVSASNRKIAWVENPTLNAAIWIYDTIAQVSRKIIPPETSVVAIDVADDRLVWLSPNGVYTWAVRSPAYYQALKAIDAYQGILLDDAVLYLDNMITALNQVSDPTEASEARRAAVAMQTSVARRAIRKYSQELMSMLQGSDPFTEISDVLLAQMTAKVARLIDTHIDKDFNITGQLYDYFSHLQTNVARQAMRKNYVSTALQDATPVQLEQHITLVTRLIEANTDKTTNGAISKMYKDFAKLQASVARREIHSYVDRAYATTTAPALTQAIEHVTHLIDANIDKDSNSIALQYQDFAKSQVTVARKTIADYTRNTRRWPAREPEFRATMQRHVAAILDPTWRTQLEQEMVAAIALFN